MGRELTKRKVPTAARRPLASGFSSPSRSTMRATSWALAPTLRELQAHERSQHVS